MTFLYLSRLFNICGVAILEHLLERSPFKPEAILLPSPNAYQFPEDSESIATERKKYLREAAFYGCDPIKFFGSCRLLAQKHNIQAIELPTIKDTSAFDLIRSIGPDLIVIGGGWPELIPERILTIPRKGAINAHPSLLPLFRGTDVHRWQIYHGVRTSGLSVHWVDQTFDTGNLLAQETVVVDPSETPQSLIRKIAEISGPVVENVLNRIHDSQDCRLPGIPQSSSGNQPMLCRNWPWNNLNFLKLDFNQSAEALDRFIRACTQESWKYNGPWFSVDENVYIARKASSSDIAHADPPGTILQKDRSGLYIACQQGVLIIHVIQPSSQEELEKGDNRNPALLMDEIVVGIHSTAS